MKKLFASLLLIPSLVWAQVGALPGMGPLPFPATSGGTVITLTISSNTANYNICTAAGSPSAATINVTVNSGVYVYASSTSNYGMDTGTCSGNTINLVDNGHIYGAGGTGGNAPSGGGGAGGPALHAQKPITITGSGDISGGGTGGTASASLSCTNPSTSAGYTAGGGGGGAGAGYVGNTGGTGASSSCSTYCGGTPTDGSSGNASSNGSTSGAIGGTGGAVVDGYDGTCTMTAATGNTGGSLGGGNAITTTGGSCSGVTHSGVTLNGACN